MDEEKLLTEIQILKEENKKLRQLLTKYGYVIKFVQNVITPILSH